MTITKNDDNDEDFSSSTLCCSKFGGFFMCSSTTRTSDDRNSNSMRVDNPDIEIRDSQYSQQRRVLESVEEEVTAQKYFDDGNNSASKEAGSSMSENSISRKKRQKYNKDRNEQEPDYALLPTTRSTSINSISSFQLRFLKVNESGDLIFGTNHAALMLVPTRRSEVPQMIEEGLGDDEDETDEAEEEEEEDDDDDDKRDQDETFNGNNNEKAEGERANLDLKGNREQPELKDEVKEEVLNGMTMSHATIAPHKYYFSNTFNDLLASSITTTNAGFVDKDNTTIFLSRSTLMEPSTTCLASKRDTSFTCTKSNNDHHDDVHIQRKSFASYLLQPSNSEYNYWFRHAWDKSQSEMI